MSDHARRVNLVYPWDDCCVGDEQLANKVYEQHDGTHVIVPLEDYNDLVDALVDVVAQACWAPEDENGDYLDSCAITPLAWGMDVLERLGLVKISFSAGRRRIGRLIEREADDDTP
jgi:hypothetical protein